MTEETTSEVISAKQFANDPLLAIVESQKLISITANFSQYSEFVSYYTGNSHKSVCQKEWDMPKMSIHCFECGESNACICLNCFLNSNHEGHHIIISPHSTGNCDCGDSNYWNQKGFCCDHQVKDETIKIEPKLEKVLTDIFSAACTSFMELRYDESDKVPFIVDFLSSFLPYGDSFRHLIAVALTQKISFEEFFIDIEQYPIMVNKAIRTLCGSLINDRTFIDAFSKAVLKYAETRFMPKLNSYLDRSIDTSSFESWFSLVFHGFGKAVLQRVIQQENINWVDFAILCMKHQKGRYDLLGSDNFVGSNNTHDFETTIMHGYSYMSKIQPNSDQIQQFFDRFVTDILATPSDAQMKLDPSVNNTIVTVSFKQDTETAFFLPLYQFLVEWPRFIKPFTHKPNLKLNKLFEVMNQVVDISPIYAINWNSIGDLDGAKNENDKLVKKYLAPLETNPNSPMNYKSFHNGGSFFFNYPLSATFVYLFFSDKMNREKLCELLLKDEYKSLRFKLIIIILKNLLSMLARHESVVPGNNHGILHILDSVDDPVSMLYSLHIYIPIIQVLLGLKTKESPDTQDSFCLKEFFIFEFAREIGFFDNFQGEDYKDENVEEVQKTYTFTILYYAMMLILERNLFDLNPITISQEQIIFALADGNKNIKSLMKSYARSLFSHGSDQVAINDIIMNVATQRVNERTSGVENDDDSNNDQCIYALKDGIEWKTITGINSLNSQKTLLNSKLKDNELIKIPAFEPEDTTYFISNEPAAAKYAISLKELVMTPTILSIAYYTLALSTTGETSSVDLNDQLAMNLIVLAASLAKDINSPSSLEISQDTTISYLTPHELIHKMKSTIFKLHEDEDGNATIENTIANSKSFASFLNMKITFIDSMNKQWTRSFIDLLNQKGQPGKEAIGQISSYITLDFTGNDDESQEKQKEKEKKLKQKEKAALLKREIMNQYQDTINNYRLKRHSSSQYISNSEFSTDSLNTDKEVCSVCSTSHPNEVLSYPLYIYRTKLPFIFDKIPVYTGNQKIEVLLDDEHFDQELFSVDSSTFEAEQEEIDSHSLQIFELIQQLQTTDEQEDVQAYLRIIPLLARALSAEKKSLDFRKNLSKKKQEHDQYLKELNTMEITRPKIAPPGWNYVLQFSICQHPLHPSCIEQEVYECPIDRSMKNAFLPDLANILPEDMYKADEPTVLRDEVQAAINNFITFYMKHFTHFLDKEFNLESAMQRTDLFVELIKSISGLISTYEVRLRSFPGCLDAKKNIILARNLFLTAWYAYRMYGKPNLSNLPCLYTDSEVEMKMTTFQKFIKTLLENDDIIVFEQSSDVLREIIQTFVTSDAFKPESTSENDLKKNDKKLCLFLRRACLSDFFLLDNEIDSSLTSTFIEWDQILSIANLSERFNIKFTTLAPEEEFEFKPFTFAPLPKQFLSLYQEPYKYPIDETHKVFLINLIDYNKLILSFNDFDEFEEQHETSESSMKKKLVQIIHNDDDLDLKRGEIEFQLATQFGNFNYPSVFLYVGTDASRVVVVDQANGVYLSPFYLDKHGSPDIGYSRGQPLVLKEEKYERLVEDILSGEYSSYLKPFLEF